MEGEKGELGNGIVRRAGRPARWSRRKKIVAMCLGFAIAISAGIASAAFLYFSNKITGTANPSGGLSLSGAFATNYPIGTPVSNDWTVTNQAASASYLACSS